MYLQLFISLSLLNSVLSLSVTCGNICFCAGTSITCRDTTEIPSEVIGTDINSFTTFVCSLCQIPTLKANSFVEYSSVNRITIQFSNVSEIEPGAFSGLETQLINLDLSDNSFKRIRPHFFNGITSLVDLDMQTNQITEIEQGSFDNVSSLGAILLKGNQIRYLPDFIFSATSLTQFDIRDNSLNLLSSRPFPLSGGTFNYIYLSGNNLVRIHSNLSSILDSAGVVTLGGNPFICDCYLIGLQFLIKSQPTKFSNSGADGATCGYPSSLVGQKISDITLDTNGCEAVCQNTQCSNFGSCSSVSDWPVCTCDTGYEGNGYVCTHPCDGFDCGVLGVCSLDLVSMNATCNCPMNYTLDATRRNCVEIKGCALDLCPVNSTCFDFPDAFQCVCYSGLNFTNSSNSFDCVDINECLNTSLFNCPANSSCENTFGNYSCPCHVGFNENLSGFCDDVNECTNSALFQCPPNSSCVNTVGSYFCNCTPGFMKNASELCVDINECSFSNMNCPPNSHCNNTLGSYVCECDPGYENVAQECVDIDECLTPLVFPCQTNSSCVNTNGSYLCMCDNGFSENVMGVCSDVDECQSTNISCPMNSNCINTFGSYMCECNQGYESVAQECVDIDECLMPSLFPCQPNSSCVNRNGNYDCVCNLGFVEDVAGFCEDLDECQVMNFSCPINSHCNNTFSSFICECNLGYENTTQECVDINECEVPSLVTCQSNSMCVNTNGSYDCVCEIGFVEATLGLCGDINECQLMSFSCPPNSHCVNDFGSYSCLCDSGFSESNGNCVDFDECTANTANCPPNSVCNNTIGSYECDCITGYEKNGLVCTDRDECGEVSCGEFRHCVNNVGSYICVCNSGFELTLNNCIDKNECLLGTHNCSLNQNCTNTVGGFVCVSCQIGEIFVNDSCEDLDECTSLQDVCSYNDVTGGDCRNTLGSYMCQCYNGFRSVNPTTCEDVDECTDNISICNALALCVNDIGNYSCVCNPGYTYKNFNDGCVDLNECVLGTYTCSANTYCFNTVGSYDCKCLPGFFKDISLNCIDNNECNAQTDLCHRDSTGCRNTLGSYACDCKTGFQTTTDSMRCVNIDECATSPCGVGAECRDLIGSFECVCNEGFSLTITKDCLDTNECDLGLCSDNSVCYNKEGSYACICNVGYFPTTNGSHLFCESTLQPPFCRFVSESGFDWKDTSRNTTIAIICPNNAQEFARRKCSPSAVWEFPDISSCLSPEILLLTDSLNGLSPIDAEFTDKLGNISRELSATLNTTNLLVSDYLQVVELFQTIASKSDSFIQLQRSFIPTKLATEIFEVASNIVNVEILVTIQTFDPMSVQASIISVLSSTEVLTQNLVHTLFSEGNQTRIVIETENILVDIQRVETDSGFVVTFNTSSGEARIDIPLEAIESATFSAIDSSLRNVSIESCQTAANFFNIKNIQPFLSANVVRNFTRFESWYCHDVDVAEAPNLAVNSDHLSASISSRKCNVDTSELEEGLIIVFQHSDTSLINSQCVYTTDYTIGMSGKVEWETIVCTKLPQSNGTHTFCNCTHLTSFAILMSPDPYYTSGSEMSIFSYIGLSISIIFLTISLLLHFLKLAISESVLFVHRNLIFSILLSQIIFVFGIERNEIQELCLIIAALLHYILLVSFLWMLIEAVNALILIKRPFIKQFWLKIVYASVAYLLPLIIVSVTLGISICDYGHYPLSGSSDVQSATANCWLPRRKGRYWAFIGPALFIIALNTILLFVILAFIFRLQWQRKKIRASTMKTSQSETLAKGLASAVKATLLMVPILGITWIFGVFALNSINHTASQVFQWLFLIFNCYQGVFIFIFYCLLNAELRLKLQLLILRKILKKRIGRDDLEEIGFWTIASGGKSKTRSPIDNRRGSKLSTEQDFKEKPFSDVKIKGLNVSVGTFGSQDREIISDSFRY